MKRATAAKLYLLVLVLLVISGSAFAAKNTSSLLICVEALDLIRDRPGSVTEQLWAPSSPGITEHRRSLSEIDASEFLPEVRKLYAYLQQQKEFLLGFRSEGLIEARQTEYRNQLKLVEDAQALALKVLNTGEMTLELYLKISEMFAASTEPVPRNVDLYHRLPPVEKLMEFHSELSPFFVALPVFKRLTIPEINHGLAKGVLYFRIVPPLKRVKYYALKDASTYEVRLKESRFAGSDFQNLIKRVSDKLGTKSDSITGVVEQKLGVELRKAYADSYRALQKTKIGRTPFFGILLEVMWFWYFHFTNNIPVFELSKDWNKVGQQVNDFAGHVYRGLFVGTNPTLKNFLPAEFSAVLKEAKINGGVADQLRAITREAAQVFKDSIVSTLPKIEEIKRRVF